MSRSGYSDDIDDIWSMIRWRGAVTSAIRGKRGQQFLLELLSVLDTMPEKKLIGNELEAYGEVCALGALGKSRGIDMTNIDPDNYSQVASLFGISAALAREIVFENDEYPDQWISVDLVGPPDHRRTSCYGHPQMMVSDRSKERRWAYMRNWVESQIQEQKNEQTHGE